MNPFVNLSAQLLSFAKPWPTILAFDAGRYLVTAGIVTVVLSAVAGRVIDRRRVRRGKPAENQRLRELRHSIATVVLFSLVGLCVYNGVMHGLFRVYPNVCEYGWTYWAFSLVLMAAAHDAYFYWTHRGMHGRSIFPRIHRIHHQSVAPTQWAAYSFSIGEALAQAAFLPLFLLVVPIHGSVLFIWMGHQIVRNVVGHCGVELIPRNWLATWWGRWLTTTLHHDMHHSCGRYNYGLYFTWWDRWCGTEHPRYRERLQSLVSSMASRPPTAAQIEEISK